MDAAIAAAGGVKPLAKALGVTHQAVYEWKRTGWCPPLRAAEIEMLYGVSRRRLVNPRLLQLVDAARG